MFHVLGRNRLGAFCQGERISVNKIEINDYLKPDVKFGKYLLAIKMLSPQAV